MWLLRERLSDFTSSLCTLKKKTITFDHSRLGLENKFFLNKGCLPFTWANRSVHSLGKWYAKFMTWKFCPGIAFTIYTNQFHLPKNDRKGLKPVSNMALKKRNTNLGLEYSVRKKGLPFQMFRCSRKFSAGMTQKVVFHLHSNRILRRLLVNIKQPK